MFTQIVEKLLTLKICYDNIFNSFPSIGAERQLPIFVIDAFGRSPYFRIDTILHALYKKPTN